MITMSKIEREYLLETVQKLDEALSRINHDFLSAAHREMVFSFNDKGLDPSSNSYLWQTTTQNNSASERGDEVKLSRKGEAEGDIEFTTYRVLTCLSKFKAVKDLFAEVKEIVRLCNIVKLYAEEAEEE